MKRIRLARFSMTMVVLLTLSVFIGHYQPAQAADNCATFNETPKTICGKFLEYWNAHGGLGINGLPITDPQMEENGTGTFMTQWFERARFEMHPENKPPYDVLLGLLGNTLRADAKLADPDYQSAPKIEFEGFAAGSQRYFPETGHNVRFSFLNYWNANGGLAQFGYPISEPHQEIDPETNEAFTMQWFERARFELHVNSQTNQPIVLLGQLGKQLRNQAAPARPNFVWKLSKSINDLSRPTGIAVNGKGEIYVADYGNNHMQKYSSDGNLIYQWGISGRVKNGDPSTSPGGEFSGVWGVALDSNGNIFVTDNNNHRIQKFDSGETYVSQFGKEGTDNGQFKNPHGIAIDAQNNIFIADTGNDRIQKFDGNGTFLKAWGKTGTGKGTFDGPHGLAVDSSGNLYVSDLNNNLIQKFDNKGTFLKQWGGYDVNRINGKFSEPWGVAVDGQNNVYVMDSQHQLVQKFDTEGNFLSRWGDFGTGDGVFNAPWGIGADKSGNVYVADTQNRRVQKFNNAGQFAFKIGGGDGAGQPFAPYSVAVDGQGKVYIAEPDNHRIQRFNSSGQFIGFLGGYGTNAGQFITPYGVAVDNQGNLYVADTGNHRIQKFDTNGSFLGQFGSKGANDNQFLNPTSVGIDGQGNIYVLEYSYYRVKKFNSSGNFLLKFGSQGQGDGQFGIKDVNTGLYSIAVDQAGTVYAADVYNHRIEKFNSSGNFVTKWGSRGANNNQFEYPNAVAVDNQGNVYVTDDNNRRVIKFDGGGGYLNQWGGFGNADGQFIRPQGITVDTQLNVYVTEIFNDRVQKFRQK